MPNAHTRRNLGGLPEVPQNETPCTGRQALCGDDVALFEHRGCRGPKEAHRLVRADAQ